jgi:vanillate O-demethylase ferredoxin subunit
MSVRLIMKLEVATVERVAADISVFTFRHPKRRALPLATAGAHVDVHLPDGRVRQYSLCGDPADSSVYRIAVKREEGGRGGSLWLHETLAAGMQVPVSAPRNHFSLSADAQHHVLIGDGIGITPMIAMAHSLRDASASFELHYCARGSSPPFADALRALCVERLLMHGGSQHGTRFDPRRIVSNRKTATHVYCCGPAGLMDAVRAATADWPEECVHAEAFKPLMDESFVPESFEMQLLSDDRVLQVLADESALDVLRRTGVVLPSSCETGVCGSCECDYLSGHVIHRDVVLTPAARRTRFMTCVSRGRGRIIVNC